MQLTQFAVQQKLTQHLKQLYSNKINFKKPANTHTHTHTHRKQKFAKLSKI